MSLFLNLITAINIQYTSVLCDEGFNLYDIERHMMDHFTSHKQRKQVVKGYIRLLIKAKYIQCTYSTHYGYSEFNKIENIPTPLTIKTLKKLSDKEYKKLYNNNLERKLKLKTLLNDKITTNN